MNNNSDCWHWFCCQTSPNCCDCLCCRSPSGEYCSSCEYCCDAYSSNTLKRKARKVSVVLLNYRIGETVMSQGNLANARSGDNNKKIPEEFINIFKSEVQQVCDGMQQPLQLEFTHSPAMSVPSTMISSIPTIYWYLPKLNDDRIRYLIIEKSARLFDEYDSYSINDQGTGPENAVDRTHYSHSKALLQLKTTILNTVLAFDSKK